ncbi:hypothetical protein AVEN_241864-1 [Araneus ventricosus]|uniref:Uncharacterized protein n=1 Tax=Araneus ventricosus TaxID=182803 RepID=A0A4Y2I1B2_ARAVE|nr:hypothetical protein AVEN_241864-1 [Araneus ventricosus]
MLAYCFFYLPIRKLTHRGLGGYVEESQSREPEIMISRPNSTRIRRLYGPVQVEFFEVETSFRWYRANIWKRGGNLRRRPYHLTMVQNDLTNDSN